jgi:LEA14-like dessication related protein
MIRTAFVGLAVMLLAATLSACSAFAPDLTAPNVTLMNAGMVSGDMFSQQFKVRLLVENPNARALPIKKIDYELFLEGDAFAKGISAAPFTVPANDSAEFDLIVNTNFMSSIGRLLSRLSDGRKEIRYDFIGTLDADISMLPSLPFRASGTVEFKRK